MGTTKRCLISRAEIARRVVAESNDATEWIWVTGGEPTIHDLDPLIVELRNELCETEEDLEYRKAILSGSWPTALEQLEEALKRAKEKR